MRGHLTLGRRRHDSFADARMLATLALALVTLLVVIPIALRAVDLNGDNLDDAWEARYGITTNAYSAADLIGWWQMDGPDGVKDRSSHQIDGKLVRFPAQPYAPGVFSNALAFPAAGRVQFPPNPALNTQTGLTFSTWIKTSTNAVTEATLVTWNDSNSTGWSVGVATNGMTAITFYQDGKLIQTVGPTINAAKVYDGNWHHIAATWAMADTAKLYVDGALQASGMVPGWTPGPLATFTFGQDDPEIPNQPFQMDETRLYDRALRPDEVTQLPVTYTDLNGNGLSVFEDEQRGLNPIAKYDAMPLHATNAPSAGTAVNEAQTTAFTDWMTEAQLHAFLKPTDLGPDGTKGHPNYWDKGHWIYSVEGRYRNGLEFRLSYGTVPQHKSYGWYWFLNITRDHFRQEAATRASEGYTLLDSNTFLMPDGEERYQGVWHKLVQ